MSVSPSLPTTLGGDQVLPLPDGNDLFLQLKVIQKLFITVYRHMLMS